MARKATNSKPDYIEGVLVAGAAIAIVALVVFFVKRVHFFHNEPKFNLANYPVRGIDVSNHNGTIDWPKVAQADYQFAYVKASEGKTHRDQAFKRNVQSAQKAGLSVGAYHFFRKNREGVDQANNLLGAVDGLKLDLPLVVDIEDWDNDSWQDDKLVQRRLRAMVQALQKAGFQVMIYTNGDGYKEYYRPNFSNLDLWLCSFRSPDSLRRTHQHVIQQYSHWGEVPGVNDEVDLNVFMGSQREWEAWLEKVGE